MIINYTHKFTFIHVPKVAGSSITVYLSPFLGAWDIQLGAWRETVDAGLRPNFRFYWDAFRPSRAVRSALGLMRTHDPIEKLSSAQKSKYVASFGGKPQHGTAKHIMAYDQKAWADHFKFCFVRNPYARMASHYRYDAAIRQRSRSPRLTFTEFLKQLVSVADDGTVIGDMSKMYTINGRVAVDFVGRFETLTTDLHRICREIGLDPPQHIPHAKHGVSEDYRSLYSTNDRELVEKLSLFEIDTFEYSF